MNIEKVGLNTKALPEFDWGQQWIRSDGELSVVVVVHEPFDKPIYLHDAFPNSGAPLLNVTTYVSERELDSVVEKQLSEFERVDPDKQRVITAHHAFIFNLIHELDFRPDMFYIYDNEKGYRRLPDCTPRQLKYAHNYAKMYIAGAFDQSI